MSKSKSLKPPVSPRSGVSRTVQGGAQSDPTDPSADSAEGQSSGVLETPAWMKKNSAPSTSAQRAADLGRDGTALETDPDRQEVKIRLSYTGVGIAAFAVIATVVLAVLVGKEWSHRRTVNTETTEQLLAGPTRPEVLNPRPGQGTAVPAGADTNPEASPSPTPNPVAPPDNGRLTPLPPSGQTQLPPDPTPIPVINGRVSRVVGLNYFVVQSYPDEAAAKASVELLAKNGIPASIERGLTGFPKWAIVVTAQGYPRGSSESEVLRRKIDQISADQARRDRKWKAWTPVPYRWR